MIDKVGASVDSLEKKEGALVTTAAVGVDIVPIARMAAVLKRSRAFKRHTFTEEEIVYCEARPHPEQSYAARFAAREAVLKALGMGFLDMGLHNLQDISVRIDEKGRPHVDLSGRVKEIAAAQNISEVAISLSHTAEVAVANAVAITPAIRPRQDDAEDPKEEMLQDFKAARPLLDELEAQLAAQFGKM